MERLPLVILPTLLWLECSVTLVLTSLTLQLCCKVYSNPKAYGKIRPQQIECHQKPKTNKGFTMKPLQRLLKTDSCSIANFSWIYGNEAVYDPVCVKNRTGFVIMDTYFPIIWQSILQSKTALSTIEVDVVVLSIVNYLPSWMGLVSWAKILYSCWQYHHSRLH